MKKPRKPPGTVPRPGQFDWPPDIFWISPDGAVIEVIGHLTAMQARPDTFGLIGPPQTREEIDAAFQELFGRGWVRGRWSDGAFSLQMERPRGVPMGNAHELVLRFAAHAQEVDVDFADPRFARMSKRMSATDFIEQRFPLAWRLNPRRGR